MHKFFTSSLDASIYLQQPDQNAGRDEILEVGKLYYGSSKDIARTLLKFNTTQISQSIVESIGTESYSIFLNLKSANSEEIPLEYIIYANAVSQSWTMGTGTKFDNITSDGVSWKYRNGSSNWMVDFPTNEDYSTGSQGHISGSLPSIINGGGGTWWTSSMASQSFNNEPDDIRMDVTNIVKLWISSSVPNDGFVIHHSLDAENDSLDYGLLKFFSKETNTIYEPKLELVWDDSTFSTGSLLPITGSSSEDALENSKIIVTDLQKQYAQNIKTKIRVKGRDMYPLKSFTTGSFAYDQSKYLPTSSYYQIEDYKTNEVIIPFGEYSKLSCDSKSNYFYLETSTYPINRIYRLKLKVEKDGVTKIIDDKLTFEIV
jgi:hypothetical protein